MIVWAWASPALDHGDSGCETHGATFRPAVRAAQRIYWGGYSPGAAVVAGGDVAGLCARR